MSHEALADLIESFKAEGRQLGATLVHASFGEAEKNGHPPSAAHCLAFFLGIAFGSGYAMLSVDRGVWVRRPECGTDRLVPSPYPCGLARLRYGGDPGVVAPRSFRNYEGRDGVSAWFGPLHFRLRLP